MLQLFPKGTRFHEDILAFQHTEWGKQEVTLFGEQHARPTAAQRGVDPLEVLRQQGMSPAYTCMYVEASERMLSQVEEKWNRIKAARVPFFDFLDPEAQKSIVKDFDTNVMVHELRIERFCFQAKFGLWDGPGTAFKPMNVRHDMPFMLLGFLSVDAEDVLKDIRRKTLKCSGELHHHFQTEFIQHIQDVRAFYELLRGMLFAGALPEWYANVVRDIGLLSSVHVTLAENYQNLPPSAQTRIGGFFDTWFQRCMVENVVGHVFAYLHARRERFLKNVLVGDAYPLTRELFSYMLELIMDVAMLIQYETGPDKKCVMYVGARHAHRLGAYFGAMPHAHSLSWSDNAWRDTHLPDEMTDDAVTLRALADKQLRLPGGGGSHQPTEPVLPWKNAKERRAFIRGLEWPTLDSATVATPERPALPWKNAKERRAYIAKLQWPRL